MQNPPCNACRRRTACLTGKHMMGRRWSRTRPTGTLAYECSGTLTQACGLFCQIPLVHPMFFILPSPFFLLPVPHKFSMHLGTKLQCTHLALAPVAHRLAGGADAVCIACLRHIT